MAKKSEAGPFAVLFFWIGVVAGAAAGVESGEGMGILIGALLLGGVGAWIGHLADAVMAWLIFVSVSIFALLVNAAIRSFVWNLLSAIFNGS